MLLFFITSVLASLEPRGDSIEIFLGWKELERLNHVFLEKATQFQVEYSLTDIRRLATALITIDEVAQAVRGIIAGNNELIGKLDAAIEVERQDGQEALDAFSVAAGAMDGMSGEKKDVENTSLEPSFADLGDDEEEGDALVSRKTQAASGPGSAIAVSTDEGRSEPSIHDGRDGAERTNEVTIVRELQIENEGEKSTPPMAEESGARGGRKGDRSHSRRGSGGGGSVYEDPRLRISSNGQAGGGRGGRRK